MYSQKQMEILKFASSEYDALICDGAVRSGKTSIMSMVFIIWAMRNFSNTSFAVCGKSVQSAVRNILRPLMAMTYWNKYGFILKYSVSNHCLMVTKGDRTNYFYVFGGKDESSYMLIQGMTLAGVFLDEVALMPRSFVEQALARCSIDGSKFWFNCNPDNPQHWFYTEWILKSEERNAKHLHFLMTDNPSLSPEILKRYESMYSGVFYERYILGQWVVAEGLVYPMFDKETTVVKPDSSMHYGRYKISCDYGTLNASSFGLWGLGDDGIWYRLDEFYHSGRETNRLLTDEEYYAALENLAGDRAIDKVIVDPSAASFITCIKRHGKYRVAHASNRVTDGIRLTAVQLQQGRIKIQNNCKDIIKEFGLYRWDEKSHEDKPIKDNDHAMDDMRYFVMDTFRQSAVRF
ncbi:MAG: PBSX family phage terminase large subunit [Clostridia bacterium]|nr:PBSX family phage terminase large subunit [Clostridia bacterium]